MNFIYCFTIYLNIIAKPQIINPLYNKIKQSLLSNLLIKFITLTIQKLGTQKLNYTK